MKYIFQCWSWSRRKSKTQEWTEWFTAQQQTLEAGAEIEPPWVAYPEHEPWWGGWRQGNGEAWLHQIWFPFWKTLDPGERSAYVEKWMASSIWREYLISPGYWS